MRNCRNSRVLQEIGVEENDADVRFQTGSENVAFRACAVKIRNITLVIGTIWSLYSCYEADIMFNSMCFQFDESSTKSALKSPKCRHLHGNRVIESNADVRIFYRNRLNTRLCACGVKTQLEVATNAAKSPKYHAKFRTLLLSITVVDFGTYS